VLTKQLIFAGDWSKAFELCKKYSNNDEGIKLLVEKGKTLEQMGKLLEAEKLYSIIQQPDLAISMYKTNRQYDQVSGNSIDKEHDRYNFLYILRDVRIWYLKTTRGIEIS